jgi:hypothetical protein
VIVSSERAEQSTAQANRALAHFRIHSTAGSADGAPGRLAWATGGGEPVFQSHDAILRLIAIAEEFSVARFVDAIEILLPSDPIVAALWEAELDRSGDTWPKRNLLWKKYLNVKVTGFPHHKKLQGFIQVRNSITHGLGSLTRRQLRSRTATAEQLGDADVRLHGDSLTIDASHVEACATTVKEFVSWLDAAAMVPVPIAGPSGVPLIPASSRTSSGGTG